MIAITVQEYAAMRGINEGAVRKAFKLGHATPGVLKRERFGRAHKLWVSDDFYKTRKKRLKKVA